MAECRFPDLRQPDLMVKMAELVTHDLDAIRSALNQEQSDIT
jgi:hypothetical protein